MVEPRPMVWVRNGFQLAARNDGISVGMMFEAIGAPNELVPDGSVPAAGRRIVSIGDPDTTGAVPSEKATMVRAIGGGADHRALDRRPIDGIGQVEYRAGFSFSRWWDEKVALDLRAEDTDRSEGAGRVWDGRASDTPNRRRQGLLDGVLLGGHTGGLGNNP
jgi:hypothetical protein